MFSFMNIANMRAVGDCDAIFGVSAIDTELYFGQIPTMQTGMAVCTIVTAITILTIGTLDAVAAVCEIFRIKTEVAVLQCEALFDRLFFCVRGAAPCIVVLVDPVVVVLSHGLSFLSYIRVIMWKKEGRNYSTALLFRPLETAFVSTQLWILD